MDLLRNNALGRGEGKVHGATDPAGDVDVFLVRHSDPFVCLKFVN